MNISKNKKKIIIFPRKYTYFEFIPKDLCVELSYFLDHDALKQYLLIPYLNNLLLDIKFWRNRSIKRFGVTEKEFEENPSEYDEEERYLEIRAKYECYKGAEKYLLLRKLLR